MEVELERMDWENLKEQAIKMIRSDMINLKCNHTLLELAITHLKRFPDDKKTNPIGTS